MTNTNTQALNEPEATVSIRNMAFDQRGICRRLTHGPLARWWLKRRGWIFYGDDGIAL